MANYLSVRVPLILDVSRRNLSASYQVEEKSAEAEPSGNRASDNSLSLPQARATISKSTRSGQDPKGSTSQRAVEESQSENDDASGSEADVVEVPVSRNKTQGRQQPVMSEYERVRQSNIERNMKLLDDIMQDSSTEFSKDVQAAPPAKKRKAVSSYDR